MSSILITGAKGMLGSMLGGVFASEQPTRWDRQKLDITNLGQVRKKIQELKPDVIVNAAAYTDVDGAEGNRQPAFAVNETGVKNLAIIAKEMSATLVHYSTDYVFGSQKESGYTEDDVPGNCLNVYGQSKLAGEQALQAIAPNFYLIRTAWLYGPYGKNFVETMLSIASKQVKINVVNDQHGSPTFTKDLARFTQQLLAEKYPFGIYHATNHGQATWYDLAVEIFRLANLHVVVEPVSSAEFSRPAQRPAYSVLKNTKGPDMRSWQDALKEYIESR